MKPDANRVVRAQYSAKASAEIIRRMTKSVREDLGVPGSPAGAMGHWIRPLNDLLRMSGSYAWQITESVALLWRNYASRGFRPGEHGSLSIAQTVHRPDDLPLRKAIESTETFEVEMLAKTAERSLGRGHS